jgi:hypothetical protein
MAADSIITNQSVAGYFKEQLDAVCAERRVALSEDAGFYVVNLLSEFSNADRLFLPSDDARTRELTPLAELMARALEADPAERVKLLRHLGDSSLYVGGFFQDSLSRTSVDVDYYVSMGGHAYLELSSTYGGREGGTMRSIYAELAAKFSRLVELLADMSERNVGLSQGAARMLRAYEEWMRTGSQRMATRLRRAGVPTGGGGVEQ